MIFNKRVLISVGVALVVPVVALAWWLLSPLFIDMEVNEEFPFSAEALVPTGMTQQKVEQEMAEAADVESSVSDSMDDAMMMADAPASSDFVKLFSGTFQDADRVHKGSGTATIYQGPNGSHVLRLEDFDVTNGPDLHVILSPENDPQSRDDVTSAGYVDLGKLKGNVGNQNYEIPNDVQIPESGSIVIYCQPFHVIFSVASLGDA